MGVKVTCEKCGKIGEASDVKTTQFPDGSYRTLCDKCFREESNGENSNKDLNTGTFTNSLE